MPAWIKADFVERVCCLIEGSFKDETVSVFTKLKSVCSKVPGVKDPDDMADECLCVWIQYREDLGNWNGDEDGPYDRMVGRMSGDLSRIWDEFASTKQSENEIRDL